MKLALVPMIAAVAACSSGPSADLPVVKNIRSTAAEWALVNRQAGEGRLTNPYVAGARELAQKNIKEQASTLSNPASAAAREAAELLDLPPHAPPDAISAH